MTKTTSCVGGTLLINGVVLAGLAGYLSLHWFSIFISAFIMVIGFLIIRGMPFIKNAFDQGSHAIIAALLVNLVKYSAISTPFYFYFKSKSILWLVPVVLITIGGFFFISGLPMNEAEHRQMEERVKDETEKYL